MNELPGEGNYAVMNAPVFCPLWRGGVGGGAEGDELSPVLMNGSGRCCKQQHFPPRRRWKGPATNRWFHIFSREDASFDDRRRHLGAELPVRHAEARPAPAPPS